jgi:hypothetical protein
MRNLLQAISEQSDDPYQDMRGLGLMIYTEAILTNFGGIVDNT